MGNSEKSAVKDNPMPSSRMRGGKDGAGEAGVLREPGGWMVGREVQSLFPEVSTLSSGTAPLAKDL